MFYYTYQKIGDLFCLFIFLDFRTVWPTTLRLRMYLVLKLCTVWKISSNVLKRFLEVFLGFIFLNGYIISHLFTHDFINPKKSTDIWIIFFDRELHYHGPKNMLGSFQSSFFEK